MSEKERVECVFLFKGAINPLALLYAQHALRSTLIQSVIYKAGVYYVTIGANNMVVIESYVKECALNGIVFDKVDFDAGVDAVYMYKG
ncbi:hypothetical protein FADJDIKG_00193 [Klebsiella phage vB_KoM-MeTiny]|nr:hypothetical protein FADJDIKG_00193 [Klebsiella phage vB_KoM-MeTiny]